MTTFPTDCVVCGLPGLADFSAPVPAVLHGWRVCPLPPRDVPHPENTHLRAKPGDELSAEAQRRLLSGPLARRGPAPRPFGRPDGAAANTAASTTERRRAS